MNEQAFNNRLRKARINARKAERRFERKLELGQANSIYPWKMDDYTKQLWQETCQITLYPSEMEAIRNNRHESWLNQRAYETFLRKEEANPDYIKRLLHEYGYKRLTLGKDIRKAENDLPGTASKYSVVGGDLDGII